MTVEPLRSDAPPKLVSTLFVQRGSVGCHVGILRRADEGSTFRLLHQAWHYETLDQTLDAYLDSGEPVWWVQPGLDDDESADLRTHAALVATRLTAGAIPYAFAARDASFARDGTLNLGESIGLTCATFVTRVFDSARIKLIREATWDTGRTAARAEEDTKAQETLVEYLKKSGDPERTRHGQRVGGEVGCTRVRAEEVAASVSFNDRPVEFARAERAGAALLARVSTDVS